MLTEIYKLILELERAIGNGAKVTVSADDKMLIFRTSWFDPLDEYVRYDYRLSLFDITQANAGEELLTVFIARVISEKYQKHLEEIKDARAKEKETTEEENSQMP